MQRLPDSRKANRDRQIALALVLLLWAVYLTSTALRFHSIDEVAVISVSRSLAARGSFDTDSAYWIRATLGRGSVVAEGIDGHTYSVKDVGPSLLALPLVWLARWLPISPVRAALMVSPLVTALTGGLLYQVVRDWGYSRAVGMLGGLIFGLASMAWPYAEMLFGQPLAAFGLLVALWGVARAQRANDWRAALIGGLGIGLAGISAVPTWITLPAYVLYLLPWGELRRDALRPTLRLLIAFGAGAGLFAVAQAGYNLARFGSPLETGYQQVGVASFRLAYFGTGSFGQLLSTPRGVAWYAPFVVLVPVGVVIAWRSARRRLVLLALAQVVLIFSLYSSYLIWSAGLNWGPRFLVAVMPALTLLTVPLFDRLIKPAPLWARLVAGTVLLVSVATQLLASLLQPGSEGVINETLFNLFLDNPPHGLIVRHPMLTDVSLLPLVRLVVAAQSGQWDVLWLSRENPDWLLFAGQLVIVASATLGLVGALRGSRHQTVRRGLTAQIVLGVALAGFMLLRYPRVQGGFSNIFVPDSPGASNISALVSTLSEQAGPEDAVVTVAPVNFVNWLDLSDGAIPDVGFGAGESLQDGPAAKLAWFSQNYDRIWLVTQGGGRGGGVELWLAQHGFFGSGRSFGDFNLIPYTFTPDEVALQSVGQTFGANGEIELVGFESELVESGDGGWLNVGLRWEPKQELAEDYTVFVHLLTTDWEGRGGHDGWPVAGYVPTTSWIPGETVDDRHVILLPQGLEPGGYRLVVGLYSGPGVQHLLLTNGSGHQLVLDEFEVTP